MPARVCVRASVCVHVQYVCVYSMCALVCSCVCERACVRVGADACVPVRACARTSRARACVRVCVCARVRVCVEGVIRYNYAPIIMMLLVQSIVILW